jgi:ferric-dicitrate binding protein FerR (iron transport regulator)
MSFSKSRILYLLEAYSSGKASPEEEEEFFAWLAKGNQLPIKKHVKKLVSGYNSRELVPSVDWEHLYQKVIQEKNKRQIEPRVIKMRWIRWAAAAAVLLLFGTAYYFFTPHSAPKRVVAIQQPNPNDIAPPNTVNAVLTLSNGQKIILDSTINGTLAIQGAVNVIRTEDGQIAYQGTSDDIAYNTLSNPRGSQVISLTLADGSKVWLNAASSLKYPTAFIGNERKVQMTGEAYFEIAHNATMPFTVGNGETSVQVLGTHFNVSAYDDESSVNVTLLEGSVGLTTINKQPPTLLKPGEQARIVKNGMIQLSDKVNIQEVMAWKNGLFSYNSADIETIMRQISRWYNVDVVFVNPVKEKFYAEAPRNVSVSVLLKMLEATKAVHFKIEGKTISVMP